MANGAINFNEIPKQNDQNNSNQKNSEHTKVDACQYRKNKMQGPTSKWPIIEGSPYILL